MAAETLHDILLRRKKKKKELAGSLHWKPAAYDVQASPGLKYNNAVKFEV